MSCFQCEYVVSYQYTENTKWILLRLWSGHSKDMGYNQRLPRLPYNNRWGKGCTSPGLLNTVLQDTPLKHTPTVSWWRHQMETFSALLAICVGNSPVPGEFPAQRPVTRSFDAFFDLHPNKRLSEQMWGWWFETLSHSLWRHCNDTPTVSHTTTYRGEGNYKNSLHSIIFHFYIMTTNFRWYNNISQILMPYKTWVYYNKFDEIRGGICQNTTTQVYGARI